MVREFPLYQDKKAIIKISAVYKKILQKSGDPLMLRVDP